LAQIWTTWSPLAFPFNNPTHSLKKSRYLTPLRKIESFVYSKRPFGGPKAVLAYLSRYTDPGSES
jgi:hypothetical protein